MLCASDELAISQDHRGILILDDTWEPGTDVKRRLGLDEPVLDIEVEPNRPDFLSVYGVAREVAALTGVPLAAPDLAIEETDELADSVAAVRIEEPGGCPRYLARVIRGVHPATSPLLAQARLTACGMRPIDAVVDATNYAMLELGQPLHGFDLARLAGPGIVVRDARDGRTPEDPRRCRADADRPGPVDLRSGRPGGARRGDGRPDDGGLDRHDRRPAGVGVVHPRERSCSRRAGSTCTPRRRTASSAASTPRGSSEARPVGRR